MARMESNASLDEQIEKAQERLQKAKAQHDSAAADLRKLLEGRDSRRQKLLMAAIAKSVTSLLKTYFHLPTIFFICRHPTIPARISSTETTSQATRPAFPFPIIRSTTQNKPLPIAAPNVLLNRSSASNHPRPV